MEMRGEGQREEGWLSLLCLLTIACVLYLCLCAISSLSLFTDVLHKSCILPFCFWCCQLLRNDVNGAKIKVSSWKADFMNTLAFCRMLTACVWQQETKGWVVCVCVRVCAPEFSEACLCASAQLICRAKLFWPWARSLVKNVDVLLVLRVRIYASQLHRFSQLFILIWILSETSLTHYLLDIIIRADALLTWQSLVLCACDSVLSCCMFAWRLGLEWLEKLPRHCKGHCYHTPHYPQLHTTLWCARTRCSLVTQPFKLHSFPV